MILVDWYLPGFKAGGQIRSIKNLVDSLEDVFDIYVVTSDNDLGDQSAYEGIKKNNWIKEGSHQLIYLSKENTKASTFGKLIQDIKPEIIYLNSMFSFDFTIKPLWAIWIKKIEKLKIILSPRGMLQGGAMQFKSFKKLVFLKALTLSGLPDKIVFHATDDHENADIKKYLGSRVKIKQTPDFFASFQPTLSLTPKHRGSINILFVSRISEKKNLHFALQILADIEPHVYIDFYIVGPVESTNYWNSCKKIIEQMPSNIKVHYVGAVHPLNLQEHYQHAHLFFLPTHGENFGHVIFDSFLYGRPVLTSDQTPWKNLLEKKCGSDISLDHSKSFRDFIIEAAFWDQTDFEEWCKNAWNYAHEKLQSTDLKSTYTELFSNV